MFMEFKRVKGKERGKGEGDNVREIFRGGERIETAWPLFYR